MESVTYLSLTGGLGNQLFQLAAALNFCDGEKLVIERTNGRPRTNLVGDADLSSFKLPNKVSFHKKHKLNRLASKSTGFVLRMSVAPKRFEKASAFRFLAIFASSIVNSLALRRLLFVNLNSGVGFDQHLRKRKFQFLVGYFQTYRFPSDASVFAELRKIQPTARVPEVERYKKIADEEKPLVVHVRLGDYKLEDSFGILSSNYYRAAIAELWGTGQYKKIWLFSDEPTSAIEVVEKDYLGFVRIIPEIEKSSCLTLEVMRFGKGYVIANSSFSWWAAFLSYADSPNVIAPSPWFIGQQEPVDLIPPSWTRRNGHV